MTSINKFVATGILALVTAVSVVSPATSEAAASKPAAKVVKKKNQAPVRVAVPRKVTHKVVVVKDKTGALKRVSTAKIEPARPSFGQLYGLHNTSDSLDLKSSVALVLDQDTNEVLFSKNSQAVLPIASLTKLMTAVVVAEAKLPLDEQMTIVQDDVDTEKMSRSRLKVGTQLNREEMLHLALMSSENRAAHALSRYYPGGKDAFVAAMNHKAQSLGMADTHYIEPTGLSSQNQSSAHDLALLVKAAHEFKIIRDMSTSPEYEVEVGNRPMQFRNTDGLVRSPAWDIGLQKTGYITEAGRCLLIQAKMAGRQLIMVFLDSAGKHSHTGDAERVRRWVTESPVRLPAIATSAPKVTS